MKKILLYQYISGRTAIDGGYQYWDVIPVDVAENVSKLLIKGMTLHHVHLDIDLLAWKSLWRLKWVNSVSFKQIFGCVHVEQNVEVPKAFGYEAMHAEHLKPEFAVTSDGRLFIRDLSYSTIDLLIQWLQDPSLYQCGQDFSLESERYWLFNAIKKQLKLQNSDIEKGYAAG